MREITRKYIVKEWNELTEEEKEKEKEKNWEWIVSDWADICYDRFKEDLEELKSKLKYITFDNVYIDENSQGWWIEEIKDFKIYISNNLYEIDNIDFKIRKTIENITSIDYYNIKDGSYDYFEDIENMKKRYGFKKLATEIEKEFNLFKDTINELVENLMNEQYYPEESFVDNYFEDMEFEFLNID